MFEKSLGIKCSLSVPKEDQNYNCGPYSLQFISYILISLFLKRDVNKAFARVTGSKINQAAGYGLEIPCVYKFYEHKPYIGKLRTRPMELTGGLTEIIRKLITRHEFH